MQSRFGPVLAGWRWLARPPARVSRRPGTLISLGAVLLVLAAVAAFFGRPLYPEARAWWVLNVFPPRWETAVNLPLTRIPSPYYHLRHSRVDTLVLHVSEGDYSSVVTWFRRNPDEVSSHYLIAKDGRIVQFVDERYAAHHAGVVTAAADTRWRKEGNPNEYSIGIELESPQPFRKPDDMPPAQRDALWALATDIVARHQIPVDRQHIVAHSEIDPLNRNDPGPGFPWDDFMRDLSSHGS